MLAELLREYPDTIPDEPQNLELMEPLDMDLMEPLDMDLNDIEDMIDVMDIIDSGKEAPVSEPAAPPPAPVDLAAPIGESPVVNEMAPVQPDPTARIYFDEDYDYESSDMDNSGFFSEPNFKHGIMTPDIWDMFKSDWGQKVQ